MGGNNVYMSKLSLLITTTMMVMATLARADSLNHAEALTKSILFFGGQRSGKLPPSQSITWRKDSALRDGFDLQMNMVGGYYDAGDNVKFHFPMAFTITMLAWSVLEFGDIMGSEQHALEAIRWGTNYFLKATKYPYRVVAQVGNPYGDHDRWERPEDMDTPRTTYFVTQKKPGSEVSAEIAAALAASSMVFSRCDARYSKVILNRAKQATNLSDYWNFMKANIQSIGGSFAEFGWDCKHAGISVLVSQWLMVDPSNASPFIPNADGFVCSLLPDSPAKSVSYSAGGLLFKPGGGNLQHVTAVSFLLIVYARYMEASNKQVQCGNIVAPPSRLINLAKSQADYILGENPLGMSYMVGYGEKFPQMIHHRASTMPSKDVYPQHIGCRDGDQYFKLSTPNPNILTGAVVGGPAEDDSFQDSRYNPGQSEPTTYINAPFVGVLAYFNNATTSTFTP